MTRAQRGRGAYLSGRSAEETVARHYTARGAEILAQRHRTPDGELDLVVLDAGQLVFVEVKQRKNFDNFASPITPRQWKRLEAAALHYMVLYQNRTGIQPVCRFDVALMDRDGAVQIIENARMFDEH